MISIIIPAYNYAQYLPEALDSLLAQSEKDWECIIINNGSFDNTADVAKNYVSKDIRFRYFEIENKGVSNSRNFALKQCKGLFIQFLDADDKLEPEKLNAQLNYLRANPQVDLVYGDARYFRDNQPGERRYSMHANDKEWMPCISGKGNTLVDIMLKRNIFPINAPLFHKRLIDEYGAFDETLTGLEDWDLWLRFAVNGSCFAYLNTPGTQALIRIHALSASHNRKMMQSHILPVLQHYLFNNKTTSGQKIYLLARYEEELWDSVFSLLQLRVVKIKYSKLNSILSFIFLLLIAVFFLPFYLLLKIYRKIKS